MNTPTLRTPGVYAIVNKINGNRYIGSAVNLESRRRTHLSALRHGRLAPHHKLRRAFEKYGVAAFEFRVLQTCERADCIRLEQEVMDAGPGYYNTRTIAKSNEGVAWSDETNRKKGLHAHKYEVRGVKGSIQSLATHFGAVTHRTAWLRVKRGWDLEEAVTRPNMKHVDRGRRGQQVLRAKAPRGERHTVQGVEGTLRELAEQFGVVSYSHAKTRVGRGWGVERAVTEVPRGK